MPTSVQIHSDSDVDMVPSRSRSRSPGRSRSDHPVPAGVDPDGAFRLCVQFSQFTAKFNDGCSVDVPQKYDEWVVDYRCYTLEMLERDLAGKVNWGSGQQPVISEFDMSGGGERKLVNDTDLSVAFSERKDEKKLFLFVDVEEKPTEVLSTSAVTEAAVSNVGDDNATIPGDWSNEAVVSQVIDWDSLEIIPLTEEQIGAPLPAMDEDTMYEFVGLRLEDERAEQTRIAAEKENETNLEPEDLQGADLLVADHVPGEDSVFYDKEDPPMKVGSIYASMDEFRAAVRQHGIKEQFELGTQKSCKELFRGYCKAEGCPWSIVARLMRDQQQVRPIPIDHARTSRDNSNQR